MEINLFFAGGIFFSMLFTLTNKLCVLLWILLLHCGCLQQAFFGMGALGEERGYHTHNM